MEKKRIGFVIFLVVGNIVIGTSTFHYLGKDSTVELIALFTSLSTAVYAILNEPEESQPLLRVIPKIRGGYGMGTWGFDLYIDNIGDSFAKDVKILATATPQGITLENNGVYEVKVLPAKEKPTRINIVTSSDMNALGSQRIDTEITYSNMKNKKQPQIKESYGMKDLLEEWSKEATLRG